jgi:tetratricopeptide (TPR) repeat protein
MRQARDRQAARDIPASVQLARSALQADPDCVEALEHLGMLLVTRRRRFDEGLDLIVRATALRPDDPGLWYSLGWAAEFAAHDAARRHGNGQTARAMYERAADAFRRCLDLNPDGKLQGDAEDLLDHVENELSSM